MTVTIGGTTGTDLSLDPASLTFTEQNWDVPQTVTVTAEHDGDAVNEAEATLTHTASSVEDDYDGLKAADVTDHRGEHLQGLAGDRGGGLGHLRGGSWTRSPPGT